MRNSAEHRAVALAFLQSRLRCALLALAERRVRAGATLEGMCAAGNIDSGLLIRLLLCGEEIDDAGFAAAIVALNGELEIRVTPREEGGAS